MGSFIITLKTINRAGIYTRSQDPALEQGSNPLRSRPRDPQGSSHRHRPPSTRIPAAAACGKGLLRARGPFKPATSTLISLQQGFQCEIYKELITGTT